MTFGAAFLTEPSAFARVLRPAAHDTCEQRTWGDEAIGLDFPGGVYAFEGLAPAQTAIVRARFKSLCISPHALAFASAPVRARLYRAPESDFRVIDVRGWEYTIDLDFEETTLGIAALRFMGRLDWSARHALRATLFTPDGGDDTFAGIFENFCRVLVSYRLHALGGVVLHSAGVTSDGGAFVFLGRSGAGKSTIARMCQDRGAVVLSDDMNALVPAMDAAGNPAGAILEKLPFTGDLVNRDVGRDSHPVRAFLRLVQSPRDALRPLRLAETVAMLVACSPIVNKDPKRQDALMGNLVRLARHTPSYALEFTLSGSFWEMVHAQCPPST